MSCGSNRGCGANRSTPGGGCCGGGIPQQPIGPVGPVKPLDTYQAFQDFVAAAGDKVVMVDFHAVWCGPCKQVAPAVAGMAGEMTDVAFCKIDVDKNREVAQAYRIESMPTFVFLRHGQVLSRFSGADPNRLRSSLNDLRLNAFDVIPTKVRVKLHSLKSAPQHNGTTGTVSAYNPVKGRYVVKLGDGAGKPQELSLKRANLHQLIEATVIGTGACTIDGMTDDRSKYLLWPKEADGARSEPLHAGPTEVVLAAGARVEVVGLVGAAQFNGKIGNILSYDDDVGRYLVQVRMDKQLKLKRENVIL